MQEDLTSCEALCEEPLPDKPAEQVEIEVSKERNVSFLDTVTLQAILCILLALGFIAVNIFNGDLAADIFELYESKCGSESTIIEVFAAIADFLGSAPINNV